MEHIAPQNKEELRRFYDKASRIKREGFRVDSHNYFNEIKLQLSLQDLI